MYKVIYSKEALNDLKKFNKDLQERIVKTIARCKVRPHAHIKKLVGSPYFCLRVGDYRVIIDIQKNELIIFVIEIGHRKKIYKR